VAAGQTVFDCHGFRGAPVGLVWWAGERRADTAALDLEGHSPVGLRSSARSVRAGEVFSELTTIASTSPVPHRRDHAPRPRDSFALSHARLQHFLASSAA